MARFMRWVFGTTLTRLELRVTALERERAEREVQVTDLVDKLTALLKRARMRVVRETARDDADELISPLTGQPCDPITFEIHARRAAYTRPGGNGGIQPAPDAPAPIREP